MQKTANEQIADVQMGFRKVVGTRDQIVNLRVIMEKANEASVPLHMAFVEYKKAFDIVKHDKLWKCTQRNGPQWLNSEHPPESVVQRSTSGSQSRIGDYRLVQDRQGGSTRMPHLTFVIQLLFRASDEGIC